MPQYTLEDAETKRRLVVEGDRAPTESEIEALFEAGERDPNISREWIYEETWRELPASDKALNDIAGLPSSAAQIIGGGVRGLGRVAAAAGPSAMLMTGGMAPSPAAFERHQAISRQVPDTISGRLTQPNQIVDAGHAIEDAAAKAFPNNQPESVNRPGRFVAEAVGNVGGALAAGPAALAFGTVAELNDAYERELQRQITAKEEPNPEKAFIKATVYSGSTVPIEMGLGVGRILRKVKQYFGSKVADEAAKKALTGGKEIAYDFLKERMKDSAAGFSQEFAEALIQDLIVEGHVDLANELKEALAGAIGQTVIGGAAQGTAIAAKQTGRKFWGEPKPSVRLPTDSDTAGSRTPPGQPQPPAGDSTAPLIGPDGKPMREIKAGEEIVSEVQRAFDQNKPIKQEKASEMPAESGATKAQTQNEKLAADLGDLNAVINDLRDSLLKSEIVKNEAQTEVAEPAKPAPAEEQQETVDPGQAEQPLKALSDALQRYEDTGEIETVRDLVDEVDNMIETGRAPGELRSAVDAYREAAKEDFEELGGRGDMDAADEAFLGAMRKAAGVETQPTPTATPAQPQSTQETSQQRIDVSAITNAETEDAMVKALGEVVAVAKTKEEIAQAKAAASQWKEDRKPTAADVIDSEMGKTGAVLDRQRGGVLDDVRKLIRSGKWTETFEREMDPENEDFLRRSYTLRTADAEKAWPAVKQALEEDKDFSAVGLWYELWRAGERDVVLRHYKERLIDGILARAKARGWNWGMRFDPQGPRNYQWLLYVDAPQGQVSFHLPNWRALGVRKVKQRDIPELADLLDEQKELYAQYAKVLGGAPLRKYHPDRLRALEIKEQETKEFQAKNADLNRRAAGIAARMGGRLGTLSSDIESLSYIEVPERVYSKEWTGKPGESERILQAVFSEDRNAASVAESGEASDDVVPGPTQAMPESAPTNPGSGLHRWPMASGIKTETERAWKQAHSEASDPFIRADILEKVANMHGYATDKDLSDVLDLLEEDKVGSAAWNIAWAVAGNSAASKATKAKALAMRERWMRPGIPETKPDVRNLSKPQLIEEILGKKPEGVSRVQDRVAWEQRYKAYAKRTKQELAQIVEADRAQKQKQDAIQQLVRPIFDSLKAEAEAAGQDWRAVLKARAEREGVSAYYPKDATRGEAAATIANKIAEKRYATTSAQPSPIGEVPVKKEAAKAQPAATSPATPSPVEQDERDRKEGEKDQGTMLAAPRGGEQQTAISDATDEINQFLGTETLPDKVQIVYEPDAPYAGYFRDGKVVINAAKTSDPVAVLLEEGMHGVIAALRSGEITDIGLLDALNEFADKVTQADIALEKALREGLDTRADVLAEEATIQKVLNENPTLVQRLVNAIRRAFKKLLGVELPADGRTRILEAAVSYLKSRNQSLPGKRFVAGNAVITAPGMGVYRNAITAHHGTPHDVDRFTTAKIGTGEGAQVYGWGLYFAENPAVAEDYAKNVTAGVEDKIARRALKAQNGDIPKAVAELEAYHDRTVEASTRATIKKAIERVKQGLDKGQIYTVSLDVDTDELLDWDKPLSEQSEKVKLAVRNKAGSDDIDVNGVRVTGSTIYDDLVSEFVNKSPGKYGQVNRWKFSEDASRYLASLGIKGIRYLDQGSRNYGLIWEEGGLWFGQPSDSKVLRQFGADAEAAKAWSAEEKSKRTYNYVIFDESVIKITHENGQSVTMQEAIDGETRFAAPRGQKQREAILPEAPDVANKSWRNRAKKKQLTKQEEYTKGVLARAVASVVHGDALPKAFREARQWGLSFQKFIEESLRVLILDARKALHAEFKTNQERLAAMDRLLAYWTGQAELNTVGGPALQRAAEAFRQTVDQLTTLAVRNGLVPEGLEDTWLGNCGAWLKRTYLAFDPTADWNYDTLKRRAARGDAEIRRIWSGIVAYLERQNPQMEPAEIEAIMRSLIDRREVEDILGLSAQPLAGSGKRFSVDISSLLRRKDLPIEVREWMGQIKDPFARGLQSGKWMAQFITRNLVQRKFARLGLEMGLLSESPNGRKTVELYPNINQLVQARDEEGNPITTEDGQPVAEWRQKVDRRREPLHGFYSSPEFAAALQEFDGTFHQMHGALDVLTVGLKTYLKGIGYIKAAKVGLNPFSYMLNTIGGIVMRLAAGGVNPVHFKDALSAIASGNNPVDGPMTSKQAQARMNYLLATKAGVTGRGVLLGDVRTNLERDTEPEEFKRALAAIRAILSDPKGGGAWVRLRDALTDIAQIPGNYGIKFMDDVFRVSAFLDELALARKAFPDQSEQQHVEWAADRASNVYQSYDRLLPVLRGLSRASVLNTFISFKFELFRNTFWIARYAAQGISSDNAALKQDGYKKAVGLMAMVGAPFALAALSRAENDTDDDEVRAFQRWAVPPWDRGEELVIVSRNGTRWRYVPMGYMLPHYEITRAINAGWKAAHDPNPDIALRKAVQGMAADYFGPGAFLGPGIEALTNKRIGGGQITYAEGWQGVKDRAAYLRRAWGPNIGDPLYQAYMGMTDQKGTYGREYDIAEVGLKLAGIRVRTVDVARQLPFSMREFGERWKNATAYANIAKRKYPSDQSRQDVAKAYRVDTQAELKGQYAQFYRDMLKLGVSEQQFLIAEKEVKLPKELKYSRIAQ